MCTPFFSNDQEYIARPANEYLQECIFPNFQGIDLAVVDLCHVQVHAYYCNHCQNETLRHNVSLLTLVCVYLAPGNIIDTL